MEDLRPEVTVMPSAEYVEGRWFSFLETRVGAEVAFLGDLSPDEYPEDDANRYCVIKGNLLEVGEDESGRWAVVDITSRQQLQLTAEDYEQGGKEAHFCAICRPKKPLTTPEESTVRFALADLRDLAVFDDRE